MTPDPEGVLLHCTTENLAWMARVIAGLRFAWQVHGPPELEDALKEHALGMLDQLGKS